MGRVSEAVSGSTTDGLVSPQEAEAMVMWNLVAHGVKWAARGLEAFSRTDAGKKTAEVSSKAFQAAKEASKDAINSYKQSRNASASRMGASRPGARWQGGETVVISDGRVGLVVRYLSVNEIGGAASDNSPTELVLLEMMQYSSELDRYLFIHENSIRAV